MRHTARLYHSTWRWGAKCFDRESFSGLFVNQDVGAAHSDVALGGFVLMRRLKLHSLQSHVLVHADDGVVRPGHANIRYIGRSLWQDGGVGGLNVGMRS